MAKKQPQAPLVTSMSTTLKKIVNGRDTSVVTPEEVQEKKKEMLSTIDSAFDMFKRNLLDGKVEMNTSLDLERLIKLTLLLSGEADSIHGTPSGEEQETTTTSQSIGLSMSRIEEILDVNDPSVKDMYQKLFSGMNELNDIDE